MNPEFMHDDELTDDDLAFLDKWQKGVDENKIEPEATIELDESIPEPQYFDGETDGDWDGGREVESQGQGGGSGSGNGGLSGSSEKGEEVKGETDGEGQGESESDSEGQSQDDSKMDISDAETEQQEQGQDQQSDGDEPKADADQETDSDKQQELENELQQDQDQKSEQGKKGDQNYDDLPEGPPSCENHCEDNDEDSKKPCPHCEERIRREREDWGCIAYDMHGSEILPGDKLKVKVPIAFMVSGATLVANVPNTEVDPARVAESTSGIVDDSICWLSGKAISQFTGWHMQGDGPIWTFQQGKKILFVEKAPQKQGGQQHEDNHQEGDNLDMEDMIEELHDDLEDFENQDENKKDDKDEEKDEHGAKLTQAQKDRFVKLSERIGTKTERTFGNTAEKFDPGIAITTDRSCARHITIESRGVLYTIGITAARKTKDD